MPPRPPSRRPLTLDTSFILLILAYFSVALEQNLVTNRAVALYVIKFKQ